MRTGTSGSGKAYSPKCLEGAFSEGCIAPVQHLLAYLAEIGCLRMLASLLGA
jgi:hypothetical protein